VNDALGYKKLGKLKHANRELIYLPAGQLCNGGEDCAKVNSFIEDVAIHDSSSANRAWGDSEP
jgi:hypothetical protein